MNPVADETSPEEPAARSPSLFDTGRLTRKVDGASRWIEAALAAKGTLEIRPGSLKLTRLP